MLHKLHGVVVIEAITEEEATTAAIAAAVCEEEQEKKEKEEGMKKRLFCEKDCSPNDWYPSCTLVASTVPHLTQNVPSGDMGESFVMETRWES